MKKLLTSIISILVLIGSPGFAYGCPIGDSISKIDIAFADIVFNGKLKAIKDEIYTFEVIDVERGKLPKGQIEVLMPRFGYEPKPKTIETFNNRVYYFRIGLSSSRIRKKFCDKNFRNYSRLDLSCSLNSESKFQYSQMPIIVRKSCGQAYIVPVDTYENSRQYAEKYKKFEDRLIKEHPDEERALALYQKTVGESSPLVSGFERHKRLEESLITYDERLNLDLKRYSKTKAKAKYKQRVTSTLNDAVLQMGPLIRHRNQNNDHENTAVELFHRNIKWFTENGEEFESDKGLLSFLGMNFSEPNAIPRKIAGFEVYQYRGDAIQYGERDIEEVARSVRRIKRLIEIDPSFVDRFLDTHKRPRKFSFFNVCFCPRKRH